MRVGFDKTEGDDFIISTPNNLSNIKKLKTLLSLKFFNYAIRKSYYKF